MHFTMELFLSDPHCSILELPELLLGAEMGLVGRGCLEHNEKIRPKSVKCFGNILWSS